MDFAGPPTRPPGGAVHHRRHRTPRSRRRPACAQPATRSSGARRGPPLPKGRVPTTVGSAVLCAAVGGGLAFAAFAAPLAGGSVASASAARRVPRASPGPAVTRSRLDRSPEPPVLLSVSPHDIPSTGGTVVLHYAATAARTCSLAVTPLLWSGPDPALVACDSSYTIALPPATQTRTWHFTFGVDRSGGASRVATSRLVEIGSKPAFPGLQSANWSGYVLPSPGSPLRAVTGSWIEPAFSCTAADGAGVSSWIGIGGGTRSSGSDLGPLLQTGVDATCLHGKQIDTAWWELVRAGHGDGADFGQFPVAPGDRMRASVTRVGSAWETRLENLTTGRLAVMITGQGFGVSTAPGKRPAWQGSTAGLAYSGGYSADWIVEDSGKAGAAGSSVPLANFGTVIFSNLETSLRSSSIDRGDQVEMVKGGTVVSTPSGPWGGGFSVAYTG